MAVDCRGLSYSTSSTHAVELFDTATTHYLEYRSDTVDLLKSSISHDADFVMPRVLLAGLMQLMGSKSIRPQVDTILHEIVSIERPLEPRERLHVTALRAFVDGNLVEASKHWQAILLQWPRDIVAIRSLHFQNFWMGDAAMMRTAVAGVLPDWDEGVPGYGFLLGMLAFGLEECGDYQRAEAHGRRAVELNPDDMWSIHAVAHVMEMQGRLEEGGAWLDYQPDHWDDRGPFKGHLWWHAALFALERGLFDQVLQLYDQHIKPGDRLISTDMQNAASLLARLEFQGVDVGARWDALAEWAVGWVGDHVIAFTDAHTMFPLARTQRPEADTYLRSLETFKSEPSSYAASVTGSLVLPIAQAISAYYAQDFDKTIELLQPLRTRNQPIGGSHAQRDVFHQLFLEAAIRAGRFDLARNLAMERVTLRSGSRGNWSKLSEVMNGLGNTDEADNAQRKAQSIH